MFVWCKLIMLKSLYSPSHNAHSAMFIAPENIAYKLTFIFIFARLSQLSKGQGKKLRLISISHLKSLWIRNQRLPVHFSFLLSPFNLWWTRTKQDFFEGSLRVVSNYSTNQRPHSASSDLHPAKHTSHNTPHYDSGLWRHIKLCQAKEAAFDYTFVALYFFRKYIHGSLVRKKFVHQARKTEIFRTWVNCCFGHDIFSRIQTSQRQQAGEKVRREWLLRQCTLCSSLRGTSRWS